MSLYRILFFIAPFFALSCADSNQNNSELEEKQAHRVNHKELHSAVNQSYDEHQYFDDLARVTPNNIGTTIRASDKIIAYNWNGTESNAANVQHHIVDAYGKFDNSTVQRCTLNKSQKYRLASIVSDTSTYEGSTPMCFIPHIAFVYFNEDKIIGQTNICFICSSTKSVPRVEGGLSETGMNELKSFCDSLGLSIYDNHNQLSPP